MFFLFNLLSSIHHPTSFIICSQLHCWFVCRPSTVIRVKNSKTESPDMLEIIQFRKDWWKLELEGMLQILQSNFIFNFTDKNSLKNSRLSISQSHLMTKSGLNLSVLTTSTVLFLFLQLVFEAFIPLSPQPTHLPNKTMGPKINWNRAKVEDLGRKKGFSNSVKQ